MLLLIVWLGADWLFPTRESPPAGQPGTATLKVSDRELQAARKAIAKAEKQLDEAAPKTQQVQPEPPPQDSPVPPQPKPREQLGRPDQVDQEAISRATVDPPKKPAQQEQELRQRQEQAEFTQKIERQQEAERKQRLLIYQEVRKAREAAERRTKLDEQRLQQLTDQQPEDTPRGPKSRRHLRDWRAPTRACSLGTGQPC